MSENTFEDRNNTSCDYKLEDLEDVQSQLYANIYYESNIEGDSSKATDVPKTIRFHSVTDESNFDAEDQHKPDDKRSMESEAVKESVVNADVLKEPVESVQTTTSDRASGKETNPTLHKPDNVNKAPENSSATKAKRSSSSSSKKCKSSKSPRHARKICQDDLQEDNTGPTNDAEIYSKYNVLQKQEKRKKRNESTRVSGDNSDSDSIFEVPVPPKPIPLLINLQDSEEEDNRNSEDNRRRKIIEIQNKRDPVSGSSGNRDVSKNARSKAIYQAFISSVTINSNVARSSKNSRDKDVPSKDKSGSKSKFPCNRNTLIDLELEPPTCMPELEEDIVLNCTNAQREVRNINYERVSQVFKPFSKNANTQSALPVARNWNARREPQNTARNTLQDMSRTGSRTGANLQEKTFATPLRRSSRLKKMEQNIGRSNAQCNTDYSWRTGRGISANMRTELSCGSGNATDWKRRRDDEDRDNPEVIKRQCIVQRCDQDVAPHCSGSGQGSNKSSSVSSFTSMPESLRNRYYSTRGQENFSVAEMQRGMSRDPRMWAILDEDLIPFGKRQCWKMRCTNCQQDGHRCGDCTNPRKLPCCHMCGMEGHSEFRCPKKSCLTCGKQQSAYRKNCEYCRVLYCTMCNSIGHKLQQCPDLWRRYHQTISVDSLPLQDPGNVMKPPNQLHCCNCAKRGHESSMCNEYRWSPHFPTPAAVSNYIDGPVYIMENLASGLQTTNISTPVVTSEPIPVPQSPREQTTGEHVRPSVNAEASSASETPIPQEAAWVRETRETSYIPITIEPSSCPKDNHKNMSSCPKDSNRKQKLDELNAMHWINIVYKCGTIMHHKNDKTLRSILNNLATLPSMEHYFPFSRRNMIISDLEARKIAPVFLEKLSGKLEFEVKIGFVREHKGMIMQVIALECYVGYINQLLTHWIHIPDDEKDYGVDVTLPMNRIKMYNLLNTRRPQLQKLQFTSLDEHTKRNENDPQYLFWIIKRAKAELKGHRHTKNTNEYFPLRKKLWRLQIKLLIIVNTATALKKCNNYVSLFLEEMQCLKQAKHKRKENLSPAQYLKLTLLYNRLFVPHTSRYLYKILHCIQEYEKTKYSNKYCPSQTQQQSKMTSCKQDNPALYASENASLFPAASCTVQDIHFTQDPPLLLQQHADNDISIERNDVNDIPLRTSDATNDKCDELFVIDSIGDQNFQAATPLTTESIPVPSKCVEKDEVQASTSYVNYKVNVSASNEGNAHIRQINQPQLNSQVNSKKKGRQIFINLHQDKITRDKALNLVQEARAFQSPHMMKAANEFEKKINNNAVMFNHIRTLRKLINLEKKYQKNVKNFCNYLQV
ncbi:hypothetical protein DMN91_006538 [Ooceraea biroi]|uniref:Zinc finger CCHC domain-containing protein 7 n=1 Tax=Ooceraea biroi TaxID=2015173 RepID=A0A3L8DQS5_OOCBI|nr:uncharacterized protein LOC105279107 isoform X1 [Ooceraea biroi]RLU22158.1 hypothetical protein DMN91_006538 [Ooceraea biroi]